MDWAAAWYAIALLALGLALLVAEFFVVSFGLLLIGAVACAAGAIYFAFIAHELFGWALVVCTPLLAAGIARWGIQRVRRSSLVPQSEVVADAGYRHVAEQMGATEGATGEMLTPARPSGRARFAGGECDVQCRGGTLEVGASVRVVAIDGPTIFVEASAEARS